jgi:hypothetical protein
MIPLYGSPQILLDIPASNGTSIIDEVGDIQQQFLGCAGIMKLQDRAWDDADVEFFGQVAVVCQIGLPVAARIFETWIFRYPIEQMVFWEHCEDGALFGDGADVGDGFLVVCFELHGLGCEFSAWPSGS